MNAQTQVATASNNPLAKLYTQLEQRADLHPRPRRRQRQNLELGRLRIGRVHLAQRNRHGDRQRRDLADENAGVILLDRTDVHGKVSWKLVSNTVSEPTSPFPTPLLGRSAEQARKRPSERRQSGLGTKLVGRWMALTACGRTGR